MLESRKQGTTDKPMIYIYNKNNDKNTIMYRTSEADRAGEKMFPLNIRQAAKLQNSQDSEKGNDYRCLRGRNLKRVPSATFKIRVPGGIA